MRLKALVAGMGSAALVLGCQGPTEPPEAATFVLEEAYSFPWLPSSDFITQFGFDTEGVLWVATFEGAIIRVSEDGEVTSFGVTSVAGGDPLHDLFIDTSNRVWVAAGASVAAFDGGAWSIVGPPDSRGLSAGVSQVAANASGEVLLAMGDAEAGGLMLRHGGSWRTLTPGNSSLPSPLVLSIEVASNGGFWVGSAQFQGRGGLSLVSGTEIVTVMDTGDGLLYNWIDDLAPVGTRVYAGFAVPIFDSPGVAEGGIQELSVADGVIDSWFPFSSGLASNRVLALTYSSSGELWFTTSIDADNAGCDACFSGVGVLTSSGRLEVLSTLNGDVAPNEFLPDIAEGPAGVIYVARAERHQIMRVVR